MLDAVEDVDPENGEENDQEEFALLPVVDRFALFSPEMLGLWDRMIAEPCVTTRQKKYLVLDNCLFISKECVPLKCNDNFLFRIKWSCEDSDCLARAVSYRETKDGADYNVKLNRAHTTCDESGASFCRQKCDYAVLNLKAKLFMTRLCLLENYKFSVARDVILNLMHAYDPQAVLLDTNALEQLIKLRRRQLFPQVPAAGTVDLFVLPELYKKTLRGEQFLLYNCAFTTGGGNRPGRVMVMATADFMANLYGMDRFYVDGTFKASPAPFEQLNPSSSQPSARSKTLPTCGNLRCCWCFQRLIFYWTLF